MVTPERAGLDDIATQLLEIGVGATILSLRKVNIHRREFVERVPAAEPIVNAALGQVEALAGPVSSAVGSAVSAIGAGLPSPHADRVHGIGVVVAEAGPELLRLSGLTKR